MLETWLVILVAVALIELAVSGTWRPVYFRTGIPLFARSMHVPGPLELSADDIAGQFRDSAAAPILFREISPGEIAFREEFISFRLFSYTPLMHGLLRYDEQTRELKVIGFVNWAMLLLVPALVQVAAEDPVGGRVLLPCLGVLLAAVYLIQFKRFSRVFEVAGGISRA